MSWLCNFMQCVWQWKFNTVTEGVWQCKRCKTLSIGKKVYHN